MDDLIEDCDWLPVWIEPDCLIRGIIDHKPNRLAQRGDLFRQAIERLLHQTHAEVRLMALALACGTLARGAMRLIVSDADRRPGPTKAQPRAFNI